MDWWRMEWPFSRVRKIFFRGRNFQEIPEIPQKERFSPNFRLRNLKFQSPKKFQLHTPSHSIPPLDSLLTNAEDLCLETLKQDEALGNGQGPPSRGSGRYGSVASKNPVNGEIVL